MESIKTVILCLMLSSAMVHAGNRPSSNNQGLFGNWYYDHTDSQFPAKKQDLRYAQPSEPQNIQPLQNSTQKRGRPSRLTMFRKKK